MLIVGAASELSAACARAFAAEGARLVLVDRDADRFKALAASLRAQAVAGDTAENVTVAAALAQGAPTVLVHTAGIDPLTATGVPGIFRIDWDAALRVSLSSAFIFARAVLPTMIATRRGRLLLSGSVASLRPTPQEAVYAVRKAGVISSRAPSRSTMRATACGPTASARALGRRHGDRRTAMTEAEIEARNAVAASVVPMGREGRYSEVAPQIAQGAPTMRIGMPRPARSTEHACRRSAGAVLSAERALVSV